MKCNKCNLAKTSTAGKYSLVKLDGMGNLNADIMLIGDAPGYEEVIKRKHLSGRCGQLLKQYLQECGIDLKDIYITDIVKCRPPKNRPAVDSEIKVCAGYLEEEIRNVKPKVIGLLGNTPISYFLKSKGVTKLRGKPIWGEDWGCWLLPMYHPNYLSNFNKRSSQYSEFKSDLTKLKTLTFKSKEEKSKDTIYKVTDSISKVKKAVDFLITQKEMSFDTETTSLICQKGKILCLSFSWKEGYAIVIPYHDDRIFNKQEQEIVKTELKRLFMSDVKKIAQNGKFDIKFLLYDNILVKEFYFDTMLASYLLNEEGIHHLANLVLTYTNMGTFKDEARDYIRGKIKIPYQAKQDIGKKTNQTNLFGGQMKEKFVTKYRKSTIMDLPIEKLHEYSAKDADATFRVYKKQKPLLEEENLWKLLNKILIPTTVVLSYMELRGINGDKEYLEAISARYQSKIKVLMQELFERKEVMKYTEKFGELNLDSPIRLRKLLFDIMGLSPIKINKLTKTQRAAGVKQGSPSTDKDALNLLFKKNRNKLLKELLDYRKLQKFYNTYIKAYLVILENSTDNKIHTVYNFCSEDKDDGEGKGTVTGRLSSAKPNLQNIPKRDEKEAGIIRHALKASKNCILIEADFKQVEFRVFAMYTKDKKLITMAKKQDIHKEIASQIFKKELDKITKQERALAKGAVFGGIMYGGGSHVIVRDFGIDYREADRIINEFFNEFPDARRYIDNQKKFAEKNGYVVNMFGRKRRLNDLYSNDEGSRDAAYRQAINARIQSTAADIVYISMIKLHQILKGKPCKMLLNIHDAIVFDCKEDYLKEALPIIKETMENSVNLSVPLKVDIEVGKNLGEMK